MPITKNNTTTMVNYVRVTTSSSNHINAKIVYVGDADIPVYVYPLKFIQGRFIDGASTYQVQVKNECDDMYVVVYAYYECESSSGYTEEDDIELGYLDPGETAWFTVHSEQAALEWIDGILWALDGDYEAEANYQYASTSFSGEV